jgi:hypothetical protein
MSFRITLSEGLNIIKKFPSGIKYYNEIQTKYNVKINSYKLKPTEIVSHLTKEESIKNTKENGFTITVFFKCLERYIKSQSEENTKTPKYKNSKSIYLVKYTGMTN